MRSALFAFRFSIFVLLAGPLLAQEVVLSTPLHYRGFDPAVPLLTVQGSGNQTSNITEFRDRTTGAAVTWMDFGGKLNTVLANISAQWLNNICMADANTPGADAGAKIAYCINRLPATGGTVDARGLEGPQTIAQNVFAGVAKPVHLRLGAATFSVTAAQNLPSNSRITGDGPIITNFVIGTAFLDPFNVVDASNATLEDFRITGTGNSAGLGVVNPEIGISIRSTGVTYPANVKVRNVEITNTTVAVYIHEVSQVSVYDSYIHDQVWDIGDSEGYGVLVEIGSRISVSHNTFLNVPRHAIYFSQETVDSQADGNLITGGNRAQIAVQDNNNGLWAQRNNIIGNTIYGVVTAAGEADVAYGILVGPQSRYTQVSGNLVVAPQDGGIFISGSDALANAPTSNTVEGNLVFVSGATARGIRLARATDNHVVGNTLIGDNVAGIAGILVAGSVALNATENVLEANHIKNFNVGIDMSGGTTIDTYANGNSIVDAATPINDGGTTSRIGLNLQNGVPLLGPKTFGALGAPANGTIYYCSDCTIANPCAAAGTGAFAKRLNGIWVCN